LAEAFDPRYRVMVLLGAYAGLRFGESALRTPHLHLLERRIEIAEGASEVNGKLYVGPSRPRSRVGWSRSRCSSPTNSANTSPRGPVRLTSCSPHRLADICGERASVIASGLPPSSRPDWRSADVPRLATHGSRTRDHAGRPPQGDPGPLGPRVDHHDAEHVRSPVPLARRRVGRPARPCSCGTFAARGRLSRCFDRGCEALTSGSRCGRWRIRTSDRSLVRRVLYP
jgi:hypothetical protein